MEESKLKEVYKHLYDTETNRDNNILVQSANMIIKAHKSTDLSLLELWGVHFLSEAVSLTTFPDFEKNPLPVKNMIIQMRRSLALLYALIEDDYEQNNMRAKSEAGI